MNDTKLIKVTGSYADGTQTVNSDIDFYVKEDKPDHHGIRNIDKIIKIIEDAGIKWSSCITGHISTLGIRPMLEFSDLFDHRKDRLKSVIIEGIEFNTH